MPLPVAISIGFAAVALGVAALFVVGVWRAPDATGLPGTRRSATLAALVVSIAVLAVTALLARSGALADVDARPPPAALLFGGITVGLSALAFTRVGDRLLAWPLGALVGVQAVRILVEGLLFAGFRAGAVPVEMTFEGQNFDLATGLLALGIGVWAWRGTVPRVAVVLWNGLGVVLLVAVVATAATSAFGFVPTMPRLTLPVSWPGVWLPGWIVPMAWFGHLLVFRSLAGGRVRAGAG